MESSVGGQRLQVLETASEILDLLDERRAIGVSELAQEMDIPKSTAHVYLKTLYECEFLSREESRYALSLQFLERGVNIRRRFPVYDAAKAEVDRLASSTGEVASLGIEEGGKRVLLYKREGHDALYDDSLTGEFTHMHWTSLGKVLLAYLPREQVDAIVDEHGLPEGNPNTITDRDVLVEELEEVREREFALEDEEHWESIRAVAVPVLKEDSISGALALSGPKARFKQDRIEDELLEELEQSRNIVEIQLRHY